MAVLSRTLMSLVIMSVLIELGMAATYIVGGPSGAWDSTTDLQTWASSQTFLVGDTLNFQYAPSHNVLEVSKADYDACQGSNSIQADSSGSTKISLSSPGKRYFICGTPGHCSAGMKLEVDTSLATASAPPPTAASAPPPVAVSAPPPMAAPTGKLAPQESPSSTLPPSSDKTPVAPSLTPQESPSSLPPSSGSPSVAQEPSVASTAPALSPEFAFSPTPIAAVIPSSESPNSISRTGSSSEDQPSAASSLSHKAGLAMGLMMLFLPAV